MSSFKSRMMASSDVAPFIRHPNAVVVLGDSRGAQIHADSTYLNRTAFNHFNWGNALSGNRAVIVKNLGYSGDRTDQVLARLPAAIATNAGVLYIHCGVNDIAQQYPTAATSGFTAFTNIKKMIDAAVANGMIPLVVVDPGAENFTPAMIVQLIELNQRLREYAEICPRMVLFDLPAAVYNVATSTTTAIKLIGYLDGVHQNNLGAYIAGKAFALILQAIMPPRPHGIRALYESSVNSLVNLLQNPMFTNMTGGILGTGVTGQVPGFWNASKPATGALAVSIADPADGSPGKEVVMAATFGAAGEEASLYQDTPNANWNVGDIIQGSVEVVVDAGSTALAGAYIYVQCNGTGNSFSSKTTMDLFPNTAVGTSEGYRVSQLTEKLVIPNYTTKSWVTTRLKILGGAPGTATVRFRRAGLKKRYT